MPSGKQLFRRGFTLIELLVVLAIIALLLSVSLPKYFRSVDVAKETVLRENLRLTRDAIGKFYADKGNYPEGLKELVQHKYLQTLPFDPMVESYVRWRLVAPDGGASTEVRDIHSDAPGKALDGSSFSDW